MHDGTIMTKVLDIFKNSAVACTSSIFFGIGVMLSVAYVDPGDNLGIALRHSVGSVFLLLPGLANRF